ncbi:uncharacterized protein AMSG_10829 [Thecamonas trahens ATCC 50062]|uniref:Fatty acid hydroxylase domain-containing protein n=1 Tax=Thecamonas trahens ATCC 50062 TaxID=461836 RepID=A0A0L0DSM3_THETB|nr:hypothetical protein AMSG_10829 [Thecamonas trahens ATCC 50062]KNC55207.1 hypothetical protein AMSG_10829 [Thecamonas trahens ATCC 50062]|eukprot:XP_013753140.1 hypothetical protein AMSG_10829 [Thecamonas trahens ATCC 50062]
MTMAKTGELFSKFEWFPVAEAVGVAGLAAAVVVGGGGGPFDGEAAAVASRLAATAVVFYLVSCAYFAHKDLTDVWKDHRLYRPGEATHRTGADYVRFLGYTLRDLVVVLPVALYGLMVSGWIDYPGLMRPMSEVSWGYEVVVCVVQYCVQKAYNAGIHYMLHAPQLYKHLHKRHHTMPRDLVATAAWKETLVEYLLMELLGNFVIGPMIFRMHWLTLAASFAYFNIVNYSEFETFDILLGTKYEPKPKVAAGAQTEAVQTSAVQTSAVQTSGTKTHTERCQVAG